MTLRQLAIEIADESSVTVISSNLCAVCSGRGAVLWYDIDTADEYARWEVDRAVRYLDARGMLRIRSTNPKHVKPCARRQ
jgi:hypothetical protein